MVVARYIQSLCRCVHFLMEGGSYIRFGGLTHVPIANNQGTLG
jgi:hypothetical protein